MAHARLNTIIDFEAVERLGVQAEVLGRLARFAAHGALDVPISATFPLERVQDAFRRLEGRHGRGKIVLQP